MDGADSLIVAYRRPANSRSNLNALLFFPKCQLSLICPRNSPIPTTAFAGGLYLQGATGTLTNSSVINNQVQAIDGVGPYATNAFFDADSLGSLSTDNIGP